MKSITVRDADKDFSKLLAEVERGEVVLITRDGKPVAELRPRTDHLCVDPIWRANFEHLVALLKDTPGTGLQVGPITEDDKYGKSPI